jgi:hypothetical protein
MRQTIERGREWGRSRRRGPDGGQGGGRRGASVYPMAVEAVQRQGGHGGGAGTRHGSSDDRGGGW